MKDIACVRDAASLVTVSVHVLGFRSVGTTSKAGADEQDLPLFLGVPTYREPETD